MSEKTIILDSLQIQQKVNRMAYEIVEQNYDEKELFIIGIKDGGYRLAERLVKILKKVSSSKVHFNSLALDKKSPYNCEIKLNIDSKNLHKKVVILVDDVANTGNTLTYSLKPLLNVMPKKIQIAVLVDRKHKRFPVCSDYVGLSLSTTIQERITVELEKANKEIAYLD